MDNQKEQTIDFAIGETITALNRIKTTNQMQRDQNITLDMKNINIEDSNTGKESKHKFGFNVRMYFESF